MHATVASRNLTKNSQRNSGLFIGKICSRAGLPPSFSLGYTKERKNVRPEILRGSKIYMLISQ